MSNNKQTRFSLRKGLSSDLPNHAPLGEPLFCTDTGELYVGMGEGLPVKKVADPKLSEQLDTIAKVPTKINGNIYGKIVLDKNNTYIIENNLILNDNVIVDGRGATIKFDGVINIGNNVEIYNCNFETLTY